MNWKDEWKPLLIIAAVFLAFFRLPVGSPRYKLVFSCSGAPDVGALADQAARRLSQEDESMCQHVLQRVRSLIETEPGNTEGRL